MTVLTANEVARLLRLAPSTVYEMARRGDLPSVRIGNRVVRFVAEDIERLIKECVGSNER
ncbi:helix-turn-helix domain-containing protein [Candidatus Solincola tengchongensis]|uniref:helix-turn-helix transcriptional regulator n=1 Tax=Candidatus Solincola tengchongensis TaxID=2900693 RepID=UPI002581056F|nr:helix-turn-helix domain-containing protein [Candidatus Solincola tengchongensis]